MKKVQLLQKYHSQQKTIKDDGAACLKSIINYYGGNVSIRELRELLGVQSNGLSLLSILKVGRGLGLKGKGLKVNIKFLQKQQSPCILHIIRGRVKSSFAVFYGYCESQNQYWIGDPEKDIIEAYTEEQLQNIWTSKCLIVFNSTKELKLVSDKKITKKELLFKFIKPDLKVLSLATILGVITSILSLVVVVFSKTLIDDILPTQNRKLLFFGVGMLVLILISKHIFDYIRKFILFRQSKDLCSRIYEHLHYSIINMPKAKFDRQEPLELLDGLNSITHIQKNLTVIIGDSMINVLLFLASIITISYFNWMIGLTIFSLLILVGFIRLRKLKNDMKPPLNLKETQLMHQRLNLNTIDHFDTIQVENKSSTFLSIAQDIYDNQFQKNDFEWKRINLKSKTHFDIILTIIMGGILLLVSINFMQGDLSLGTVVAIFQLVIISLVALSSLVQINSSIEKAKLAFENVYYFISGSNNFDLKEDQKKENIQGFEEFKMENLAFEFLNKKQLFNNVSLTVKKGEQVVLVGANGSGKSTLIQIIQRFYPLTSGAIQINGIDSDQISIINWRKHLGVVPQQIKFIRGNVIDNILFGEEPQDNKELESFLSSYGFDNYFKSFPKGYFTKLGNNGKNISNGQRQLVGLARVLWKKPSLLLLDNTVDNFDSNLESFFWKLIEKINPLMGILIFTNRIPHTKFSQQVYLLEDGKTKNVKKIQEQLDRQYFPIYNV